MRGKVGAPFGTNLSDFEQITKIFLENSGKLLRRFEFYMPDTIRHTNLLSPYRKMYDVS